MTEAPSDESRQDAVAQTNLQAISATPVSVTAFVLDAYQILSQLSTQDLEQLSNSLKELTSQIQSATTETPKTTINSNASLSGTGSIPAPTSTGTLSTSSNTSLSGTTSIPVPTSTGTLSTVTNTITELLPQPQAKQLTDLITTRSLNLVKMLYYLISILRMIDMLPNEPIQNITQPIIDWAEQQLAKTEDN